MIPLTDETRRGLRPGDVVRTEWTDHVYTVLDEPFVLGGELCVQLSENYLCFLHRVTHQVSTPASRGQQPAPEPNDHPAVWDLVVADMQARDQLGAARYGTRLQPHNGRDSLRDAYEEALDLAAYLRAAMYERDGK